jgi:Ca2+-binding RTX toxin-like protein
MRALRVLALCVAVTAAGPGAVSASTITYEGDAMVLTGQDGANHEVQYRLSPDTTHDEIIDSAGISSFPGTCDELSAGHVSCPGRNNVELNLGAGDDAVYFTGSSDHNGDCFVQYDLNLGEGDNRLYLSDECDPAGAQGNVSAGAGADTLNGGSQPFTFLPGGGNDTVTGGVANETLRGGEGNDRLIGGPGNDQIFGEGGTDTPGGGAGNDLVDGGEGDDDLGKTEGAISGNDAGAGADAYVGGPGTDRLWLDGHPAGMTISIDGAANDGAAGEGDNVGSDIESILGTPAADVFTGTAGRDTFDGGGGNDELHGADGDDLLYGGAGDDKVYGDGGADRVEGSYGLDTVDGGAGQDGVFGDTASCSVFCSFDADVLFARDGEKDVVDCGGGADQATVDEGDVVSYCSTIYRPAATGPVTPGTPGGPAGATATLATTGAARIRTGVGLAVTCPAACQFSVELLVNARTAKRYKVARRIGSVRGSLLVAGRKAAKLRLSAKARKRMRRARSVPATLRLKATDAAGKTTTVSRKVTLKR